MQSDVPDLLQISPVDSPQQTIILFIYTGEIVVEKEPAEWTSDSAACSFCCGSAINLLRNFSIDLNGKKIICNEIHTFFPLKSLHRNTHQKLFVGASE